MFWTWIFWTFVATALSYVIGEFLRKDAELPHADPDQMDVPTVKEGTKYTILFGTHWIENPVIAWWGDIKTTAIEKSYEETRWFRTKTRYYTVGYHYAVGMHLFLCEGMIDGVKQIKMQDTVVWPDVTDEAVLQADGAAYASINEPELFGGEDKEGGVVGQIDFQYGGGAQTVNTYLSTQLGANISASRGLTGAILRQVRYGTSPYPKTWKFLCKRTDILTTGDTQWYSAKAVINTYDLNPAHILHECITNNQWGLGYSPTLLRAADWEDAADTLYTEGFGLSRKWEDDNETIEELIKDVLKTIDAKLFQDLATGEIILKLIRDDYDVGALEQFDESDVIEIENFTRGSVGEVPSMVELRFWDVLHNTPVSITDHDIALLDLQGGKPVVISFDYLSITDLTLAGKVAARERQQIGAFPAQVTLVAKRTMSHLKPGDVFKFSWAPLGIIDMVLRVGSCNYGSSSEMKVKFTCVEDVFAVQSALYANPPATGWTDPRNDPAAALDRKLMEVTFWDILRDGGISAATALDDDAAFLQVMAVTPSQDAYDFELMLRDSPSGSFYSAGRGAFSPNGTLDSGMLLNAADATITMSDADGLIDVQVGQYAIIEDEILKVTNVDAGNDQVTLARGCLDTVPAAHSSSTRVWFADTACFIAGKEYTATNQPGVKILPKTDLGQLAIGDATAYNVDAFDSRMVRPYPPGDFKVDGASYPTTFSGQPTISWKHRDRLQQIDEIIEHDNVSIGPEAGTTYTLKIYDEGDSLVRTETGLTGTDYTYSVEDEMSDCGIPTGDPLNTSLRFVLYSVRDGYDSWQSYDLRVNRA
jgi:hypothetical protein